MKNFKPELQIDHLVGWIRNYFATNGNKNTKAVIGISGGKDSTIAAALLVRALGPKRVVGVLMPNGEQADIADSYRVCTILGIERYVVNIHDAVEAIYQSVDGCENNDFEDYCIHYPVVSTNTPARIRMTTLYAIAGIVGGRVCNTGNRSEKYVGYTTKYGDLAGDFALFHDYTVRELLQVGDLLEEIPHDLIHKAPADGMTGKTDEEKLGFTYEQVDDYLLDGIIPEYDAYRKIVEAHQRNLHKDAIRLPNPYRFDENRDWHF